MATLYPYTPGQAPFQFRPTLNGGQYAAVITVNLGDPQRSFLNLYNTTGSRWVLTTAVVGSLAVAPINLVAGYLPGAVLWYDAVNMQFVTEP